MMPCIFGNAVGLIIDELGKRHAPRRKKNGEEAGKETIAPT
jgi:hypothetical protein